MSKRRSYKKNKTNNRKKTGCGLDILAVFLLIGALVMASLFDNLNLPSGVLELDLGEIVTANGIPVLWIPNTFIGILSFLYVCIILYVIGYTAFTGKKEALLWFALGTFIIVLLLYYYYTNFDLNLVESPCQTGRPFSFGIGDKCY